jgi:hypothetical protein
MKTNHLIMAAVLSMTTLILSATSWAGSNPQNDDLAKLRGMVAKKFLLQANDSRTDLGQLLQKLNDESKDGRNSEGTLPQPIRAEDLQIVNLESTLVYVPWHYAERKGNDCKTKSQEGRFAVFVNTRMNAHYSQILSNFAFTVSAFEILQMQILSKDAYSCEDHDAKVSKEKISYQVDPFVQMKPIE